MQHADRAGPKIALPSRGVEQATELPRIELYRYGVDREVPPGEILFDRRRLNCRQESGMRIGLLPGCRDIHLEPVWEREPRRRKPFKYRQPGPIPVGHQPREANPISFYRKIEVPVLPLQQEIADDSADEVDGHPRLSARLPTHEAERDAPEAYSTKRSASHRVLHGTPL